MKVFIRVEGYNERLLCPSTGAIQEATDSYVGPFLVSGTLIALGGIICLPVRRVARWEMERDKRNAASKATYSKVNTRA